MLIFSSGNHCGNTLTCPSAWAAGGQDFLRLKYNAEDNHTGLFPPSQSISEVIADFRKS